MVIDDAYDTERDLEILSLMMVKNLSWRILENPDSMIQ